MAEMKWDTNKETTFYFYVSFLEIAKKHNSNPDERRHGFTSTFAISQFDFTRYS